MLGPLAGLASAPILAQSLGVDGRGMLAGATAPLLLISAVATLGVPDAVTYFVAKSPSRVLHIQLRAVLLLCLSGVVATAVSLILAPVLAGPDTSLASLISLASMAIIPTILVSALRGTAAGLGLWKLVALERAIGPLVRLLAIIALVVTDNLSLLLAVAVLAFSPVVGGLAYLSLRSHPADREHVSPSMKSIAGYGARVWFGAMAGVLLMRLDQVLLVPLSSATELGLYVVAVTISELPLVVNSAVREVVFASDARSSENTRLTRAARLSFLVCALIALFLGSTAAWWLPMLFGDEFAPALPVLLVLLVAVCLGIPGSVAGAGLSGRGRPHLRSWALVVACVVNVTLFLVLAPALGALGAALATLAANLFSSNLNIIQFCRRFDVRFWDFYAVTTSDIGVIWHAFQKFGRR